jgi:hypothetical protein
VNGLPSLTFLPIQLSMESLVFGSITNIVTSGCPKFSKSPTVKAQPGNPVLFLYVRALQP